MFLYVILISQTWLDLPTSGQPPYSGASRFLLSAFFCCLLQRLSLAEYFCCCLATVMIDCGGKSAAQLIITGGGWQPGRDWTLNGWHSCAGCGMMRPLGGAGHDGATLALMSAVVDKCPW
jgi:hypothetical protein